MQVKYTIKEERFNFLMSRHPDPKYWEEWYQITKDQFEFLRVCDTYIRALGDSKVVKIKTDCVEFNLMSMRQLDIHMRIRMYSTGNYNVFVRWLNRSEESVKIESIDELKAALDWHKKYYF